MISLHYDQWFIIAKTFFFSNEAPNPKYINLATHIGEDMKYQKFDYDLVDFPGEYDIRGISIQCFLWNQNKLNYLINHKEQTFAIIQSADVLENNTDLATAKIWFYTTDNVVEKIDQLELEGEKTKLETPELSEEPTAETL